MMNDKVEVQIGSRRLTVVIEELTSLEINAIAQKVSERMLEIQKLHPNTADSSKIALLVAISFAADLDKEARAHEMTRRMLENSADRLSQSLRESLDAGGPTVGP
jgi:cell division protein ZapA (FtsZ GTPase activity inhibitor)